MGNKSDGTRFSIEKGYTGVSDPTATLSAITKGVENLATWKKGRDDAAIQLKKDTSESVRQAELEAQEKLTGNKSVDAAVLKGLESTKNKMYQNQKKVQVGASTPTDNLIFRQNAKQAFDILSENLNNYDVNFQKAQIRAKGGYNDDGDFVNPTAGGMESAIQELQTTLGNPNLYEIISNDDGTLSFNFYKTKINELTKVREVETDEIGNPILDPSMTNVNSTAFFKNKNQIVNRIFIDQEVNAAYSKDSPLNKTYQSIKGNPDNPNDAYWILDTMKNDPLVKENINTAIATAISTPERRVSVLVDNMPYEQQQTALMPSQVKELESQGVDLDEMIKYTYTDISTGETLPGEYNKYVKLTLDPNSSLYVPEESEASILAAERIVSTRIYAGLNRMVTGISSATVDPSIKEKLDREERRKIAAGKVEEDDEIAYYNLIDDIVVGGNESSLQSLARQVEGVSTYRLTASDPDKPDKKDSLVFYMTDGSETAPIPIGSGRAIDAGALLVSEIGGKDQTAAKYIKNSKAGESVLNTNFNKFKDFDKPQEEYGGLGRVALGVKVIGGITSPETALERLSAIPTGYGENETKLAAQVQSIVDVVSKQYKDLPKIVISGNDEKGSINDIITMTVDGKKYSNKGYLKENKTWVIEKLQSALRGELTKRTIRQIRDEDGLSVAEATKKFNEQK